MSNSPENPLPELHRLHLAVHEVQEDIDRGPRQLKVRNTATVTKQTDLDNHKQKLKQLKMVADQKSLQLKTNEAKISDLKGKLNQAASNREFDIIRGQIEADKVANSVLEDEILEALEKVDAVQAEIKRLEEEVKSAQAEEARCTAEIEQKRPGLEARLTGLRSQLNEVETRLPEELTAVYRRLVAAHGSGALAPVENSTCTSCYVRLTPQATVTLQGGAILMCRTCGRMLYAADE